MLRIFSKGRDGYQVTLLAVKDQYHLKSSCKMVRDVIVTKTSCMRHRAASDNVSEQQSGKNTLLVVGDDDQSELEPEHVENNSPEA